MKDATPRRAAADLDKVKKQLAAALRHNEELTAKLAGAELRHGELMSNLAAARSDSKRAADATDADAAKVKRHRDRLVKFLTAVRDLIQSQLDGASLPLWALFAFGGAAIMSLYGHLLSA